MHDPIFLCRIPSGSWLKNLKTTEDPSFWRLFGKEEPQQLSARLTHEDGSGCDFYHRMTFDLLLGLAYLEIPTDQDMVVS